MAKPYTVVFLDVGTTLVDPHPSFHEVVARICREHGYPTSAADVERAEPGVWVELRRREEQGQRYGLTRDEAARFWHDVYTWFLHGLGIDEPGPLPGHIAREFLKLETWQLYPDALPTLHELRRRGYRLGVVSNWEDWLEELLISLEVAQLFEFAVISGVELVAKPDTGIYRRALELAGVAAHEAVHVGDSLENDVQPARALGIDAVLLDRGNRLSGRHEPRITSLLQLPEVLEDESSTIHVPHSTSEGGEAGHRGIVWDAEA